jgi:sigma-B regulation protein RsbU (phosphoserine phosphatase)
VPHLRLSSAEGPGEVLSLSGDRLLVGRSRECDLVLPDVLLSRRHVEFFRTARGWLVRDLGSMNGTRVNDERIGEERVLYDGDVVGVAGWGLAFSESDAPPVAELTPDHPARVHDITSLATKSGLDLGDLSRQSRLLGVLTRAASALVSCAKADELLDTLLAHLLDAIPARRGAIAMIDDGPLVPTVVAAQPGEDEASMVIDPAVADRVLGGRSALLAPRVPAEDDSVRSVLCAPLWFTGPGEGSDRVVGLVVLEAPAEPTPFGAEHLSLMSAIVNLAASRLESVRLRAETADKRRLEEDLRGAARIQASLLPEDEPSLEGWDVGGSSRLCSAVGADYYDFTLERDELLVALGDVAGKGLAAALLMAALRAAVRALWAEPAALPDLVARINENLLQTLPPNRYATLFLARLQPATGELRYVNTGHTAPVLVRADGRAERLEEGGTILGAFPSAAWQEGRVQVGRGEALVLLSDGVVEAAGTGLTPEAVAAEVRRAGDGGAPEILEALQAAAEAIFGGQWEDDHTFVVLKRLADPPTAEG